MNLYKATMWVSYGQVRKESFYIIAESISEALSHAEKTCKYEILDIEFISSGVKVAK